MSTNDTPEKDPEFLSTLARGLSVLTVFNHEKPEMQLSEVAAATKLSPAAARRCLNTLVQLGYVGQHGRRFLLRPKVLEFGSAFLGSMNLEQVATPHLQKLRDETGDSSSLAVLSESDVLYLVHVSTNRRIRLGAGVGTRFPVYATSLGRVLMAYQPEELVNAYLENVDLRPLTEYTLTAREDLQARFSEIRRRGYDTAQDELDYGIISISVPVFDHRNRVAAAINCSTSTTRIAREELVKTRLPLLQSAAGDIEAALRNWPFLVHSLQGE